MSKSRAPLSLAAVIAAAALLGACSASGEGVATDEHDHSAHEAGGAMDMDGANEAHENAAADAHAGHDMSGMEHTAATAPMLKKIEPSADYPLSTCVVSGEELGGAMGPPMAYEYGGQEVQFCCDGCLDEFKADPDKFMAKVRAAASR